MPAETNLLGGPRPFPTTHWSLIRGGQAHARPHLEELCRKYWGPVYFYIRRNWNKDVETAKDLTQAFFTAFLEKDWIGEVDADKGRFRTFVCASLHHFLCKQTRYERAEKRTAVPLPDRAFDDAWKGALVEAALARLRRTGDRRVELLARYALSTDRPKYEDLAREFAMTVAQVTNALHWARKAFKQACVDELRETVATEEDFQDELRRLFS